MAASISVIKNKHAHAREDPDENLIDIENLVEKIPAKESWVSEFTLGVLILGSETHDILIKQD